MQLRDPRCSTDCLRTNQTFSHPLPPTLSFHLSISSAALVLTLRTLAPATDDPSSLSAFSLRHRLGLAPKLPEHDESNVLFPLFLFPHSTTIPTTVCSPFPYKPTNPPHPQQTFHYHNSEVRVREKVRVESQDPSLIAVMAKLSALGHGVAVWRRALGVVMGVEGEGEGEG